jgi:hypothetical protein
VELRRRDIRFEVAGGDWAFACGRGHAWARRVRAMREFFGARQKMPKMPKILVANGADGISRRVSYS